jgi:hypothetical protein
MLLIFENKIWKTRGFCINMDQSDHAQIFHTGGFEGEEFK